MLERGQDEGDESAVVMWRMADDMCGLLVSALPGRELRAVTGCLLAWGSRRSLAELDSHAREVCCSCGQPWRYFLSSELRFGWYLEGIVGV